MFTPKIEKGNLHSVTSGAERRCQEVDVAGDEKKREEYWLSLIGFHYPGVGGSDTKVTGTIVGNFENNH